MAKKKILKLSRTENENILIKIENLVREKGIILVEDIQEILKNLPDTNKKAIISALGQKKYIKITEDILEYNEKEEYDDIMERQIFSSLIRPEFVDTEKNGVQVGGRFFKGLYSTGFPAEVEANWLSKLASEKGNVDFSIFVEPSTVHSMEIFLSDMLKKVNNDLYKYQIKKIPNPSLEERKLELEQSIKDLISGKYRHFRTSLYLVAKGDSKEAAETLFKDMHSTLLAEGIESEEATLYQEPLLKSIIPVGMNYLKGKEILVPDKALAASFPFSFPFLDIDEEDGTLLGWNESGLPIARSIWKEESYSGAFSGPTGSGKSFAAKIFSHEENDIHGSNIIVIDPAATKGARPEYQRMCKKKNGRYISFSTKSKNIPNVMAIYGENFSDEVIVVEQILTVLLGGDEGLTPAQKPILEKALIDAYEQVGITKDEPPSWKKDPPTLDNLHSALIKHRKEAKSEQTRMSYEALINRLSRFVGRGLYSFINTKKSELALDNPFTVFEFKETPEEIKPALTAIVMNYIKSVAMGNLDRTIIVLEEVHLWLRNPVLAEFLATLIVLVRKSNTGIVLIFQDLGQLKNCQEGLTLLGNLQFVYLLGCKKSTMPLTAKTFSLNQKEQDIILNSEQGKGILIWGREHFGVKIDIDPETAKLIETNPEKVKALEAEEELSVSDEEKKDITLLEKKLGHKIVSLGHGIEEFAEENMTNPHIDELNKGLTIPTIKHIKEKINELKKSKEPIAKKASEPKKKKPRKIKVIKKPKKIKKKVKVKTSSEKQQYSEFLNLIKDEINLLKKEKVKLARKKHFEIQKRFSKIKSEKLKDRILKEWHKIKKYY